ncbi:MAG TPA: MMPL family transporter, partial [Archangium sp.]
MKRVLDWLVSVSSRHPWRIVGLSLLTAVAASAMSARLGFRGDFTELLPASTAEVKDLKEIEDRAGGTGYLILQVLGDSREQRQAFAAEASAAIEAKKNVVRFVEWRFDTDFVAKRALLLLETDKLRGLKDDLAKRIDYEKKIANPLYVDLGEDVAPPDFKEIEKKYAPEQSQGQFLESKDGDELYMLVKATSTPADLDFNRKLIGEVKDAIAPLLAGKYSKLSIHYTGAHQVRVEDDDAMQADLQRSVVIASILTLLIILAISRRVAIIAVVFFPVTIGISATFAFAWVLIGHLNPVTGFLGAILIGLGIEYGLHLAMRYWEERRKLEPVEAMRATLHATFEGALSSAVTNSLAFGVLVFAEFEAFKQFGLLAGVGVIMAVLVAYGLGPALLVLAERLRPGRAAAAAHAPEAPATPSLPGKRMPTTVVVTLLLSVLGFAAYSLYVLPRVGFETNLRNLKGDSPTMRVDDHITEQLGASLNPA